MSLDLSKTPLGRAFGWSGDKVGKSALATEADKQEPLRQRPAATSALRVATVRSALPSITTGSVPPSATTGEGRIDTLSIRLENPHTLCYINASILALLHVGDVLGRSEDIVYALRQEIEAEHRRFGMV